MLFLPPDDGISTGDFQLCICSGYDRIVAIATDTRQPRVSGETSGRSQSQHYAGLIRFVDALVLPQMGRLHPSSISGTCRSLLDIFAS